MQPRFVAERGIQQDDPLFPYLFVICAEHLGRYINFMGNQKRSGIGIKLNKDTPKIPNLTFVDDCIILYRANKVTARNIKQILDRYCMVSGKVINYQKSMIQFSNVVSNVDKKKIS